ncbi:MAG: hypothetical protein HYV90_04490 [Candidatus Woesebacteria bacterium]|nr:MAG: hypothetical protein HYV90_04490 [Candidatus Woesebacteria bacterium]
MKLFKIITIGAIILLIAILAGLSFQYYRQIKLANAPVGAPTVINLKGVIKLGKDTDPPKYYCPNELYIVAGDKTYQLRTPDGSTEKPTAAYAKYRNSEVELKASFQDLIPNCDPTLPDCSCDQFVLVESIKETKKAEAPFPTFSGTISCLPLISGKEVTPDNCALGLVTNDGKYYILKNVPDSKIVEGATLTVTGEIDPGKVKSIYKIDAIINVVEIK